MAENVTTNGEVYRTLKASGDVNHVPSFRQWCTDSTAGASVFVTPVAATLANGVAYPVAALEASVIYLDNGSTLDKAPGDATNGMLVNLGGNNNVTLATLPDTAAGDLAAMVVDLAAIEAVLGTIDTKTPALGQALAAGSVPVVLTAAQITTLTPPAAITGFATEAKQPALGTAGTASTDVITVQGIASMTPLSVDGSGVTQPVSATALPLPAGAATQATLATLAGIDFALETGGNLATIAGKDFALESGGNLDTIASAVHAEDAPHTSTHAGVMMLGVRNENDTTFVAGANDYTPIATTNTGYVFVAGTQVEDVQHVDAAYGNFVLTVRKDTAASTAGTTNDYAGLTTDANGKLWVNLVSLETLLTTIDGDTGSILITTTSCANSLQVMDDWDETNRCAVNIIASQAGITGGAGAVAANTPRMTLASDDPLVTRVGEVQGTPTSNTVLGRLKDLLTGISLTASASIIGLITPSGRGTGTNFKNTALSNTVANLMAGVDTSAYLHWLHVYNPNSSVVYVQLFQADSGDVTLGTTAPTLTIAIQPYSVWENTWLNALVFSGTPLSAAATTTATGNTAPSSAVVVNGSGTNA